MYATFIQSYSIYSGRELPGSLTTLVSGLSNGGESSHLKKGKQFVFVFFQHDGSQGINGL